MIRTHERGFVGRFGTTWSQIRRAEISCGLWRTLLAAAGGVGLLAAADYWWELPWSFRAAGLAGAACLALAVALVGIAGPIRWRSRPRTAREVEHRFPQLGQRVRTVVQYAGRSERAIADDGALPTLVAALENDTDAQTGPLDLGVLVPRRKIIVSAVAAIAVVVLLAAAVVLDGEWRRAARRALLDDAPYTSLSVSPGDVLVDRGGDVKIALTVEGRVPKNIFVYSRSAEKPEAGWEEREPDPAESEDSASAAACYQARLEKLQAPLEYRAVAGKIESPVYRISVRLPIAIAKFEADLTPPAYTGLAPRTVPGGDLEVIEGTQVKFRVQLDRPPAESSIVLSEPAGASPASPSVDQSIPVKIHESALTATARFIAEKYYRITARAHDGTRLPENRYHVRVRKDQPPQVSFLEPEEALEVHPIAEVPMKIRVDDDFGLTRAGLVFRVNSGEDRTLVLKDFKAAGKPPNVTGNPPSVVHAMLEEMLMLEQFNLGQTDSISYYAFAEDNYPGGAKRTETELRFIDIRPFRRIYKVGGT